MFGTAFGVPGARRRMLLARRRILQDLIRAFEPSEDGVDVVARLWLRLGLRAGLLSKGWINSHGIGLGLLNLMDRSKER